MQRLFMIHYAANIDELVDGSYLTRLVVGGGLYHTNNPHPETEVIAFGEKMCRETLLSPHYNHKFVVHEITDEATLFVLNGVLR